ncbi:MAG: class I SAM-dependent methyltransferase [Candidatus Abyssobacteria bacterium SURF_17]|jgi:ubiquinone/menaquinone biosynthesis C-methylase UbiE|uniref:Class I SAM-dependent methyltransferase n=1 Tax=Candidatus Abyssobacteria bacterium SURF_17 TaxID=2093361 RepID=A0A419EX14_9BACT|nr:MAG: class I SAM-dependent methyltransferase [Candidatus Abyssubacteria bacterium SURF_17]
MNTRNYIEACRKDFWKRVFQQETNYAQRELSGCRDILSVGCGPAVIEGALCECGFEVTGLDVSEEALNEAPDGVRTILGSAEQTNIGTSSFDAILYVASLQFIDDYMKALRESERILKPGGTLLVMLLNPESFFFEEKRKDPTSYINNIKHIDINAVEKAISEIFIIEKAEYFLGIRGEKLFDSTDPRHASLYCIKAKKRG